jgi:uncharacterized membrane protein YcjF (UPF0283 family)
MKQKIYNILKGKFLVDEDASKNWILIGYLTFLALIMIASSHSIDRKVQLLAKLTKQQKKLREERIATSSDLMKLKLQSAIVEKLENQGLYMSENPPTKIVVINKEK